MLQPDKDFAVVVWMDATGTLDETTPRDIKHKPDPIYSYGFVLRSDEAGISLAHEWMLDDDYRTVTFIPRGMVKEEIVLKLTKKRAPKRGTQEA